MKRRPTHARRRIDPAGITGDRPADGEIIQDESFGWWNTEDKKRLRGLDYDPDFATYREQLAIDVPRMTDAQAKRMFLKKQKFQDKTKKRAEEYEQSKPFVEKEVIKEKTRPDGTSLDAVISEMGYGDHEDDVVFGQMEMETKPSPELVLATGKKEHAKKEKEAGYKIPISNQQLIAIGLQLLSGRESGLEAAGKSLSGSKSQEEILAEKANKESLARRREAQSAYEFTKEQRETLEGIAKNKVARDKLKVDIARLKSDIATNSGKLAVSRFKNTPDFYKIAPLANANGKEYTDDELEELSSDEKIAAVRRSINKISPGYFPVTKKAATGGTIPNTLSKLGISSIRKV
jgi:hypothetical protein